MMTNISTLKNTFTIMDGDHMPRRRKRHYSKMSLMLLILVVILSPLLAQTKEESNSNSTSKGENMLSSVPRTHQHVDNVLTDTTNDKNTFKRLKPTDFNDGEEGQDEEEERSSEVIEMIQPTHNLRHQEHYKQRILLAEKDLQKNNLNRNIRENDHEDDAGDYDVDDNDENVQQERELSLHNRYLRYQQIQLALREPLTSPQLQPQHHHRRHEHHLDNKQRFTKQMAYSWPQQQPQHHLRHQHHHHTREFQQQPQLRHLNFQMRKQNLTVTKAKPPHQRYFDRESMYVNPFARMMTTEGPHLRHTGGIGTNRYWKSMQSYTNNPHNHLYNDEANNNQNQEDDIKRISLSLDGAEIKENANRENKTLNENGNSNEKDNVDYDVNDNEDDATKDDNMDNDDDDFYSYEDDNNDDKETNKPNRYATIATNTKTNVKRYTNPLIPLNKPSSAYRSNTPKHHLRHTSHNGNSKTGLNDDDYEDDIENYDDNAAASSPSLDESSNVDDDDKVSDEKWNKIEHEHYRKQLQHQRAMQALRSRRPSNEKTAPTPRVSTNRFSFYSSPMTNKTAWSKRQTTNDDDGDNIYSRYYVPGTVTRKKEEELGSPTAILESRRQYALQQRQNKALASAHHRRIVTEGSCRLPQPRVERIRRDSWKIYTPHCTILHRCADDAGCCPSERQTCAPKRTKNVDLYFFVISLNETQGSIEKLSFVNHTECHCINRSKQRAPEYGNSGAKDLVANNQVPFLRRATILNCYCPNLFEKILQEDGYCRCDCSSGNMGCDWLKRGMEHFSMNDRKCILEGRCKLPTCEYGQYIKKHGRCPRREERHLSADIVDW